MKRYRFWANRFHAQWLRGIETLFSIPLKAATFLILALFVAIAVTDFFSPPRLNLTFVYVFVIILAVWNTSATCALLCVVLASLMQAHVLWHLKGSEGELLYFYVDLVNRVLTLLVVMMFTFPLKLIYQREKRTARIDALTESPNRQAFDEFVSSAIARQEREQFPFCVAYIDLDNFKHINDRYGHGSGDRLLKTVAHGIRSSLRKTDHVARIGGDEFAMLLPHTDLDVARQILQRVTQKLRTGMEKNRWPVTFSIGLGSFNKPGLSPHIVLDYCDSLMYSAKRNGKNAVIYANYPQRKVANGADTGNAIGSSASGAHTGRAIESPAN